MYLDFCSSSFTVLKLHIKGGGKKKGKKTQFAVLHQATSAAPAGLRFPERETETQKRPGLKQILISVWGGRRVPHAYVKRCVRGFQSKYSSLSMDSVVVAILGNLMSPGDDSEEFICSRLALI